MTGGFPHSDIPGSKLVCQLPEAFRRLPRPSSPPTAKASTVCASSLDHITPRTLGSHALTRFRIPLGYTPSWRLPRSHRVVKELPRPEAKRSARATARPERLTPPHLGRLNGGAREDRTPDLLRAKQALSQLSYGPSIGGSGWS
jgi:hypothetical protein